MIKIHDRDLRGKGKAGWLDSRHTFSFGQFYDPSRMGFRSLRVINDDYIIGGAGFPTHGHKNMEIITYVLEGALEHKDSTGTGAVIRPGDIQRMSAGSGIEHSEFNHSKDDQVHLLQIWILPEKQDIEPGYEQKSFAPENFKNRFYLVGDKYGTDGAITIHQDIRMLVAVLEEGKYTTYTFEKGRGGFLQVARGQITLNGEILKEGDGAEISDTDLIDVSAQADSEVILFDMA
ncbi:MAG TPA: pirin family protein [Alphaproteobacteria bacterium]|nr:pirin family protein [Alphaproteobacteria bacterium]